MHIVNASQLRKVFKEEYGSRFESNAGNPFRLEKTHPNHADMLYAICLCARHARVGDDPDAQIKHRQVLHQLLSKLVANQSLHWIEKLSACEISESFFYKLQTTEGGATAPKALVLVCTASHVTNIPLEQIVEKYVRECVTQGFLDSNPVFKFELGPDQLGDLKRLLQAQLNSSPYVGLQHFREEDEKIFFGRDRGNKPDNIESVINHITRNTLTTLIGASGSGKSSLAFAGVVPRLRRHLDWKVISFRPANVQSKDPFLSLSSALLPFLYETLEGIDQVNEQLKLAEILKSGVGQLATTIDAIRGSSQSKVLILIDQFEEVFTIGNDADLTYQFLTLISDFCEVLNQSHINPNAAIAITLRDGFLEYINKHPQFAQLVQSSSLTVLPLDDEGLRLAIEEPAKAHDVEFESGLVETMLADAAKAAISLPLVEYALEILWQERSSNQISFQQYYQIGGISGALGQRADQMINDLAHADSQIAENVFIRLVGPRSGNFDTRLVVEKAQFESEQWGLITRLANERNRLIVVSKSQNSGRTTAEITHEALIYHWPTLASWIERNQAFMPQRQHLENSMQAWLVNPNNPENLLSGDSLANAKTMMTTFESKMNSGEKSFVLLSLRYAKSTQRQKRILRWSLLTLMFTTIILLVAWNSAEFWRPKLQAYWEFKRYSTNTSTLQNQAVGTEFQDCRPMSSDCPRMVTIRSEQMSEELIDRGHIDSGYLSISTGEITQANWLKCVQFDGCDRNQLSRSDWKGDSRAVGYISWHDAMDYVTWLSESTGVTYKLLSRSEWEYSLSVTNLAEGQTALSGKIHNLGDGKAEWSSDCLPIEKRIEATQCNERLLLGGSQVWRDIAFRNHQQSYTSELPTARYTFIGFRVAR